LVTRAITFSPWGNGNSQVSSPRGNSEASSRAEASTKKYKVDDGKKKQVFSDGNGQIRVTGHARGNTELIISFVNPSDPGPARCNTLVLIGLEGTNVQCADRTESGFRGRLLVNEIFAVLPATNDKNTHKQHLKI
jgi:hypothetical protein